MPLLTRRQFIAAAGVWALARAAGIKPARLERALAASPVTLDSVPIYLTFDDGVETELAEGKTGLTIDVLNLLDAHAHQSDVFFARAQYGRGGRRRGGPHDPHRAPYRQPFVSAGRRDRDRSADAHVHGGAVSRYRNPHP